MIVKIQGAKTDGSIKAIPSKSYAHRIAICNYLAGNSIQSGCDGFTSKDILATENCLKEILSGGTFLDCGESGSTLRFLLPLVCSIGKDFILTGHGKLMERPNDELLFVLSKHGISAKKTDKFISVSGKLTSGDYQIRGDISSQYVSGLLMALPTLQGDSTITLTTPLLSAPYVDITLEVLRKFGVNVIKTENGYFIRGGQKFSGKVQAEGDWSNSAFFLVLGVLNGKIEVSGLNLKSVQGDKAILELLNLAGVKIQLNEDKVTVYKSEIKPFVFDGENCPDLVPIISVMASFANGISVIKNVSRLKIKESDRIESTISTLKSFGVKAEYEDGNLIVYGNTPTAGKADSFNDHRIVMSSAVMACACVGESVINGAEAVEKSYPTFFNDLKLIGGKLDV